MQQKIFSCFYRAVKRSLRERFTAPFSHFFCVLKMCENVEIRRFYASDPTFSHIFKTEKMWKNGAVKRSLSFNDARKSGFAETLVYYPCYPCCATEYSEL